MIRTLFRPGNVVYLLLHALLLLAGYHLATRGSELIWQGVGVSLIAAGVTGWVVFVYLLLTEEMKQRLDMLYTFGVRQIFESRAASIRKEYDVRLGKARKQIDVLGFGLRALREDYADAFSRWSSKAPVRILLIDPEFPTADVSYASQRDKEEKNAPNTIAQDVRQFVVDTESLRSDRFQVKLYRCLPTVNIFRIDDELFFGPYLIKQQSRNTPTIVVGRGGLLFDTLAEHFEAIWNDPELTREIPKDWG